MAAVAANSTKVWRAAADEEDVQIRVGLCEEEHKNEEGVCLCEVENSGSGERILYHCRACERCVRGGCAVRWIICERCQILAFCPAHKRHKLNNIIKCKKCDYSHCASCACIIE